MRRIVLKSPARKSSLFRAPHFLFPFEGSSSYPRGWNESIYDSDVLNCGSRNYFIKYLYQLMSFFCIFAMRMNFSVTFYVKVGWKLCSFFSESFHFCTA